MIAEMGQVLLAMSFVLLWPIWSINGAVQIRAFYMHSLMLVFSVVILMVAFLVNDFSLLYVAAHSHVDLPIFYRMVAMWGGHSGSLLLFGGMMSTWMTCSLSKLDEGLNQTCLRYYTFVIGNKPKDPIR